MLVKVPGLETQGLSGTLIQAQRDLVELRLRDRGKTSAIPRVPCSAAPMKTPIYYCDNLLQLDCKQVLRRPSEPARVIGNFPDARCIADSSAV
jgi:hypothetical protein